MPTGVLLVRRPERFAVLISAAVAFVLTGALARGAATFGSFLFLAIGVLLPLWLLVGRSAERFNIERELADLVGLCGALIVVAPLYVLRNAEAVPTVAFDLATVIALWSAAFKSVGASSIRRRVLEFVSPHQRLWICVILPFMFAALSVGYDVRVGDTVRYYGLFFVDFGNLVSVTNTLKASHGLPLAPIVGTGHLAYHWLYFCVPAWASEFAGLQGDTAGAFQLSNLLTAVLFYKVLCLCCARALGNKPRIRPELLAGLSIFGLSTLYVYQLATQLLHRAYFSLGTRNHLMLQLPNSLTCFGNNTLALCAIMLGLEALTAWNETGNRAGLAVAAFFVAMLPGYSITLLFSVSLSVLLECLRGVVRRPVLTLAVFASVGATTMILFSLAGLFGFGRGGAGLVVAFDRGQFVQNVLLGFAPITVALVLWLWKIGNPRDCPYRALLLSCLLIPTWLMTRGTSTEAVDFSIKTGSLYLAAAVPLVAQSAAWVWTFGSAWLRYGSLLLVTAGVLNSATYVLQNPAARFLHLNRPYESVPLAYRNALAFVHTLPSRSVLLDELSLKYATGNPALMIAGKRVLVSPQRAALAMTAVSVQNQQLWRDWQASGFSDQRLASRLSTLADVLIVPHKVVSPRWSLLRAFGQINVYGSNKPRQLGSHLTP